MWRGKGEGLAPHSMGAVEETAALVSMYMYWLSRTWGVGWRAAASATLARSWTAPLSTVGRMGLLKDAMLMTVAMMARPAAAAATMARRGRRGRSPRLMTRQKPDAGDPLRAKMRRLLASRTLIVACCNVVILTGARLVISVIETGRRPCSISS